jgi:uncharacterized membrane protein (UPF0127 family)
LIRVWFAIAVALALMFAACGSDNGSVSTTATDPPGLTRITFVNKDGSNLDLLVEVADTPEERSKGLMSRESLPENQGMLFVFESEGEVGFWMKDTLIPLSIAFIEGEGKVIDIQDMEPQTETVHKPDEPYLYAVEANQGWFARNGIETRSQVRLARTAATSTPADCGTLSPAVLACLAPTH